MILRRLLALLLAPVALGAGLCEAHPLAPALYEIRESVPGRATVTWKMPLRQRAGARLAPILPDGCERVSEGESLVQGTGLVLRYDIGCSSPLGAGQAVAVAGIAEGGGSVLVRIVLADGSRHRSILSDVRPVFRIPDAATNGAVFHAYLAMGGRHILGGVDHLLFVLALVLLVPAVRQLVWVVTAFTVGHSVTLSLAILGYLKLPPAPVEIMIALSVLIIAAQLARPAEHDSRGPGRSPWLLCGIFGLLHGLGFAGALREAGLPAAEIPLGLFAFNVGIELGQLVFIGSILALSHLLGPLLRRFPVAARQVPAYAIGCTAGFWLIERLVLAS